MSLGTYTDDADMTPTQDYRIMVIVCFQISLYNIDLRSLLVAMVTVNTLAHSGCTVLCIGRVHSWLSRTFDDKVGRGTDDLRQQPASIIHMQAGRHVTECLAITPPEVIWCCLHSPHLILYIDTGPPPDQFHHNPWVTFLCCHHQCRHSSLLWGGDISSPSHDQVRH